VRSRSQVIIKKLSSFLLMHKDKQKGEDSFTYM